MELLDRFKQLDAPVQALIVIALFVGALVALVVLLALLVVLAAVVGSFTLGLGEETAQSPVATFQIEGTPDGAEITHNGGDAIDARNLYVSVDGQREPWNAYDTAETVRAGDSIVVGAEPGQTVRVIYGDGETQTVLEQATVG